MQRKIKKRTAVLFWPRPNVPPSQKDLKIFVGLSWKRLFAEPLWEQFPMVEWRLLAWGCRSVRALSTRPKVIMALKLGLHATTASEVPWIKMTWLVGLKVPSVWKLFIVSVLLEDCTILFPNLLSVEEKCRLPEDHNAGSAWNYFTE